MSFSKLKLTAIGIDPTPEGAKAWLKGTVANSHSIITRGTERWSVPLPLQRDVRSIIDWGLTPRSPMASSLTLQRSIGCKAIDLMHADADQHPGRRYFLVTLLSDAFNSFDRDITLWLTGMKRRIYPVMALGNYDGWFGRIEVQTDLTYYRGLGRLIQPHFHAIAYSDDADFCPDEATERMCASKRLVNFWNAPTADARVRPGTSVSNIAAYVFKGADIAKRRVPSKRRGFRYSDAKLPPGAAVRQMEILSLIEAAEMIIAGGSATRIRDELFAAIDRWTRPTAKLSLDLEATANVWRAVSRPAKRSRYREVKIERTDAVLPLRLAWFNACPEHFLSAAIGRDLTQNDNGRRAQYDSSIADAIAKLSLPEMMAALRTGPARAPELIRSATRPPCNKSKPFIQQTE